MTDGGDGHGGEGRFNLQLNPGQRIYAEESVLTNLQHMGQGGNGRVFRMMITEGKLRGLSVAVKFLEVVNDDERVERFEQEIELLQELDHPHVIEIYETGTYNVGRVELPFFVMEYQPRNLKRELGAHPKGLHPDIVVPVALQIASGLAALHEKDVVHRDLKPSNLLFDGTNAKLADLGIAKVNDEERDGVPLTADGEKVGPHFYMSPEQWKFKECEGGNTPDSPSDIFQFGLVLYQMTTGMNPNTVPKWSDTNKDDPQDNIWSLDGSVTNDLAVLARDMIDTRPENRPSIGQVQDRLLGIFDSFSSHYTALYGVRPGREF